MIDKLHSALAPPWDFAFCEGLTDIGGEIWADLESRLDHVEPAVFRSDVSSQFAAPARAASAA